VTWSSLGLLGLKILSASAFTRRSQTVTRLASPSRCVLGTTSSQHAPSYFNAVSSHRVVSSWKGQCSVNSQIKRCSRSFRASKSSLAPLPKTRSDSLRKLRAYSKIVGITPDGTNDHHKSAHVGFFMGIAGTEVPRRPDIIFMDDNFSTVTQAIMWVGVSTMQFESSYSSRFQPMTSLLSSPSSREFWNVHPVCCCPAVMD